ncbi:MAG: alanine--glyoxylate aminotransferase family protein [Verrucomicrobiae bacterium]|nr:alanine--glyoxylate aminotransferase family protein [Verrucomicrobiae bacterium]
MRTHTKLFIPGPVEVSEKTFAAFTTPMIGHRGKDFAALYAEIQPKLQQLLFTKNPVYLSTSSAWGVMEASVRNLVNKSVLNCCCGAFSDKWYDVSLACGKAADKIQVEWGQPILPGQIDDKLKTGQYDALTLIHNETSTGVMNPLSEIAEVMRKYPDVMFIVDSVSSMSGVKIETDKLGIDVLLAGTQKCFALPPGFAVFAVSARAIKRAATVPGRGYYFDFIEFQKNHEKNNTPSTPSVAHIYALRSKLEDIFAEGLEARFARHQKMAEMVRGWAKRNGFELFPEAGYESVTLTCVRNTRQIDVPKLNATLKERYGCIIDGGYGKIKGTTFRIAHMGDETTETIAQLLGWLDDCL